MPHNAKDARALVRALDLPASTCHHPDGRVEIFVHTDPKSLDKSLSPIERSCNQALEWAKHDARRRRDGNGGTRVRPKKPVLTG